MRFITIPADLTEVHPAELQRLAATLGGQINKAKEELEDGADPDEGLSAAIGEFQRLVEERDRRQAAKTTEKALASVTDEVEKFMRSDDVEPQSNQAERAGAEPAEPETPAATDDGKADKGGKGGDPKAAEAGSEAFDVEDVDPAAEPAAEPTGDGTWRPFTAAPAAGDAGVDGRMSYSELAAALRDAVEEFGDTPGKRPIGRLKGNFSDDEKYVDDMEAMFERFSTDSRLQGDELTAALCAPARPLYDLACDSLVFRPVKNRLPRMEAAQTDRGKVSVYPSPSLADIDTNASADGAYGVWTSADDANPASAKGYTEITCGNPTSYEIYAVWRALRAHELLLRTYPELIAAYLNKLEALWARTGEVQLLNAMASGAVSFDDDAANHGPTAYGATVSVARRLVTLMAFSREQERWGDQPMDVWMPRWVLTGMVIDLMSRNGGFGPGAAAASEEAVIRMFAEYGFDLAPTLDNATFMVAIGAMEDPATAGALAALPTSCKMLVSPKGKYRFMDRGDLTVGQQGVPLRDSTTITKNVGVMFYETFEGLVDTNSCPAYILETQALRFTGHQVRDIILDSLGREVAAVDVTPAP